jgi:hypothetical protein
LEKLGENHGNTFSYGMNTIKISGNYEDQTWEPMGKTC